MRHRPEDYTDMDLDRVMVSEHAPLELVIAAEAEKLRRTGQDTEALEELRVHLTG